MNQTLGNTKLVEHGIQTEVADLRYHVGVAVKKIFVFEPRHALSSMRSGRFRKVHVKTGEIVTATGYLIPYSEIHGCRMVDVPLSLFAGSLFSRLDSTSIKGKKAETLVNKMIKSGLLSTVLTTVSADDVQLQIEGIDIIPDYAQTFQVKCDWGAGPTELGGTGNLFIQDTECNPLKLY